MVDAAATASCAIRACVIATPGESLPETPDELTIVNLIGE